MHAPGPTTALTHSQHVPSRTSADLQARPSMTGVIATRAADKYFAWWWPGDGDAAQVMICFDTLLHLKRCIEEGLGAAGQTACLQLHHTLAATFHRLRLPQVEMQASVTILLYLLGADDAWIVSAVHVIDSTQWTKRDAAGQLQKRLVRHRPCRATHSTARAMHSTGFAAWYSIRLVSLTSTIPSHQAAR